jgi:hypothetical protein
MLGWSGVVRGRLPQRALTFCARGLGAEDNTRPPEHGRQPSGVERGPRWGFTNDTATQSVPRPSIRPPGAT